MYSKFWASLFLFFLLGTLDFAVLVSLPFYSSKIINALAANDSGSFYQYLEIAAALSIASLLTAILVKRTVVSINENIAQRFRLKLLSQIFQTDFRTIEGQSVGDNISRITNDVGAFKGFFAGLFCQVIFDLLSIIVLFVLLVRVNSVLTFLILGVTILSVLLGGRSQKQIIELSKRLREVTSKIIQSLQDWLSKAPAIKMYSIENIATMKFDQENKSVRDSVVDMGKKQSLMDAMNGFIFSLPSLIILGYGGYKVLLGATTIGALFAFLAYTAYFLGPTRRLFGFITVDLPSMSPVIDRIEQIIRIDARANSERDESWPYSIAFENVGVKIGKRIATMPSFKLQPGDIISISGANGSGKSTIGKVLTGLYSIESGIIKVNDQMTTHSFLSQVSFYLPQKPVLFPGTIAENLTLFGMNPDEGKIENLINDLQLNDWIGRLPSGIHHLWTPELNQITSGGEFQKICLARALYTSSKIIVLDEPETYLDVSTKSKLKSLLSKYCPGKVIVIISHSTEFAQLANKFIHCRVDNGDFNLAITNESTHVIAN